MRFSIQKKLFIFQFVLLTSVVVLVGWVSVSLIVRHLEIAGRQHLELVAHDIVFHFQNELKIRTRELALIALEGGFAKDYETAVIGDELERFLSDFSGSFPDLSYVDKSGWEKFRLQDGERSLELRNLGQQISWLEDQPDANPVRVHLAPMGKSVPGPALQMSVSLSRLMGKKTAGIIFAEIPLADLGHDVCYDCEHGSSFVVFDRQGRMLMSSRPEFMRELVVDPTTASRENEVFSRAMALDSGFSRIDFFSQDSYVCFQPLPELQLAIMVGVPYADFDQLSQQLIEAVSALFLVILILGSLASYLVSKTITGPLAKLNDAVRAVAQGDFSCKVKIHSHDEVEELADNFNRMTSDLGSYIEREKSLQKEKAVAAAELLKARKMEAIGLMAGGVAHDLNNILGGVTAYPELLLTKLDPGSELAKPIRKIQQAGYRAAAVVADLLTVARGSTVSKKIECLNRIVEEYLESPEFQRLYSLYPNVRVCVELETDLPVLLCSRIHILKVLMNLVGNAVEAIPGTGQVTIATACLDDGGISLRISDNGPGIAKADQEHIFEPFYSRKVMGRSGTGLGLTIVWNVIQEHDGWIDLESSSAGTAFSISLPAAQEQAGEMAVDKEAEFNLAALRGKGRILVVDDESEQLEIASEMLNALGYQVVTARDGKQTLQNLSRENFDLLLLDMILAGRESALSVYSSVLKSHPRQKAIVVSGFSLSEEVKTVLNLGAGGYLRKPYTLAELGRLVQRELRSGSIAIAG